MKFDCGRTREQKCEDKQKWHRCFAWYPIRVGPRECRWLEYIERKGTLTGYDYEGDEMWTWEFRVLQ